jgi:hypothetical protein
METAGVVGKTKEQFFPQHLAKRLLAFRTVPTGPAAVNQRNNKTGHFTCYKNRTFSFATDRQRKDLRMKTRKSRTSKVSMVRRTSTAPSPGRND